MVFFELENDTSNKRLNILHDFPTKIQKVLKASDASLVEMLMKKIHLAFKPENHEITFQIRNEDFFQFPIIMCFLNK